MAKPKSEEKRFLEYLDRLLAGQAIDPAEHLSDDMHADLEFARSMLASHEEAPPGFQYWLKERLLRKLAEGTDAGERRTWFDRLFEHRRMAMIALASVAVVAIVAVAIIWRTTPAMAPMPGAALPANQYTVNLPARITPDKLTFSTQSVLSDKPGSAVVYYLKPADASPARAKQIADRLGLANTLPLVQDASKITLTDKTSGKERQLTVWKATGAVEYGLADVNQLKAGHTPNLPTAQDAKQIGYDTLSHAGLLPSGYGSFSNVENAIIVTAGGSYPVMGKNAGQTAMSAPQYWIVDFPFVVNGVEATGPGAKIEVAVGEGGQVINLLSYWRELTPRYSGTIISSSDAYAELAQGGGSIETPLNTSQAVVKQVALKYWMDPPSESQVLAMPVYEFKGECLDKSGRTIEEFTAWTKAIY
jgi:hypothetical protein